MNLQTPKIVKVSNPLPSVRISNPCVCFELRFVGFRYLSNGNSYGVGFFRHRLSPTGLRVCNVVRKMTSDTINFMRVSDSHSQFVGKNDKIEEKEGMGDVDGLSSRHVTQNESEKIRKREANESEVGYLGRKLHFMEERDEESLSRRMLSLSRANKVRSAIELYGSMEGSNLLPSIHACNSLLLCLIRNNLLDDALRVFGSMKEKGTVSGHTYSLILKSVSYEWGSRAALDMFEELDSEGSIKSHMDIIGYNTVITLYGKERDWQKVEKIWRRIEQDGCVETVVTFRLLISTFARCNQIELALAAYFGMIRNGCRPEQDDLSAIITACAKDGDSILAVRFFNQMLDSGYKPGAVIYNTVMDCLGKAGKVGLAFKIYNHMRSSGLEDDSYTRNSLLNALYRAKRYGDVVTLFDSTKEEGDSKVSVHLYNVALMSCEKLGWWDKSLQLLWHMETKGISPTTQSYNLAIHACEEAGKLLIALQVYDRMLYEKCVPDTFTFSYLVRCCVAGALWSEMDNILDQTVVNGSLYNLVVQELCFQGKVTLAKKYYKKMHLLGLHCDAKSRDLMQHLSSHSLL